MRHLFAQTALIAAALAVPHAVSAQDASLNPTFGTISLTADFLPDPNWVYLLSGGTRQGSFTDAASGQSCSGYFESAPDFRMTYTAGGTGLPLSITSQSSDDTVLLVNGPDGQWYCNDDTFGLNSAVTFPTPLSGVYNIWVGTYSSTNGIYPPAELGFTELTPFEPQILRSFFGRDDRLVLDPTLAPWSMIGLVEMASGSCTGTLIGPSTVLTAGHCLFDLGDGDNPPVLFRAGYQSDSAVAQAGVTGWHIPAQWRTSEQEGYDFAFFYLDQPLGDQLGWMEIGPLSQADLAGYANGAGPDILQAGYSADQPDVLTGNIDCPFVELGPQNTLIHQCDTVQGDSGSPLFVQDGAGFRIIGVESYTEDRPELEFDINVAMYIANVVTEFRSLATTSAPAPVLK